MPPRSPKPPPHDRIWPSRSLGLAAAADEHAEAATRLQQLCGAATAKAMEDCLFYRDARLVSLNEVGGEPDRFGVSAAEFHQRAAVRARRVAAGHDHADHPRHQARRGRARPHRGAVAGARRCGPSSSGGGQTPPRRPTRRPDCSCGRTSSASGRSTARSTDELRDRLHAYAEKAIREAALHTTWNDPNAEFETAVHDWLDARDRRTGRRRTDRARRPARPACPQRRARPEAHRADRARRSRRLPGHRVVGRQPGRPRQPQARGLSQRARGRAGARRRIPRSGWCSAALRLRREPARHVPGRWLHAGARRRVRPPSTWWRSCAATTCWSRSAAGPSGSAKPAGATRFLALPDGTVDRPSDRRGATAAGLGAELFAELPVALLERAMAEHEFAVWAPRPERVRLDVDGTLHPMTPLRRRLVARRRRRRTGRPIRVRARRRPEGAARSPLAAAARRCARALAAVAARARRVDRRAAGRAARSRAGRSTNCTSARSPRRAPSTRRSRSWTIWSISASTSSS